jgi:branched-chain amino acid transport system permease protein
VIGGVGTLLGPIVGSLVLTLLSDGITELLAALGWELPGTKQVSYGLVLLAVVLFLPHGIWPAVYQWWQRRHTLPTRPAVVR